jgi:hypothetical protein
MPASRMLMAAMLSVVAVPLIAQSPETPRWALSVTAGPGFGGPAGQLRDRMLEEQWTDQYCDNKLTECHQSPNVRRLSLQFAGALGRRLTEKLELKAVFEVGDLGEVAGAKGQYTMRAGWKTTTLGTAIMLHPVRGVRIGGGPLIAMLTRLALPTESPNPIRAGLFVEGGVRSSERTASFLELNVSYRMLPKVPEGPWPGHAASSQVYAGPTGIDANFSHLTVGLGAGVRF